MAHGAGGKSMHDLIEDVFLSEFGDNTLLSMSDSARLDILNNTLNGEIAFTSDSFVVDPIFFPGGDIGKLAVCGTVNDLAVSGAKPLILSFCVIIEEGFAIADLRRITASAQAVAKEAGIQIVTGDTKVVSSGDIDGIFINTAGIGHVDSSHTLSPSNIQTGDKILVSNTIGDHGAAIMVARGELGLESDLVSDCRPLNDLCMHLTKKYSGLRAMRDATRGGVAAVLNEFSLASNKGFFINEANLPLKPTVRGVSEILGLDPLYLANEGLFVAVIDPTQADAAMADLQKMTGSEHATIIGDVHAEPSGILVMNALLGGQRLVEMPDIEQLPRIC